MPFHDKKKGGGGALKGKPLEGCSRDDVNRKK